VQIGRVLPQRQRKRAANQPGAKYRNPLNHMSHRKVTSRALELSLNQNTVIPSEARDLLFR
jgi:hypothetical protein